MKILIIDAIVGAGFAGSFTIATQAEKAGLAHFSGHQHAESWAWHRAKLEEETVEVLQSIYEGIRAERELQDGKAVAERAAKASGLIAVPLAGLH